MPNEVKAYSCKFGCRRRVSTSRRVIEKHESTCAMNPARRACKTCKHKTNAEVRVEGGFQHEPGCEVGALPYGAFLCINCDAWMEGGKA